MKKTIDWLNARLCRDKEFWISFVLLVVCSLIISGGVTKRNVLHYDISMLNIAYGTAFDSTEKFISWFNLWQFQRLIGAFGQICLFPVVVLRVMPKQTDAKYRVPVTLGYRRSTVLGATMIQFAEQIVLLSIICVVTGAVVSGIHFTEGTPVTYYFRCVALHVWRDLGFGGLALAFSLLSSRRAVGACISFFGMLLLAIFANTRIFDETLLNVLLSSLYAQDNLWLWQVNMIVNIRDVATLALFPFVTFGISSVLCNIRYCIDAI